MRFKDILLSQIIEGDDQRTEIDEDLVGLSESIEKYDVLQPILVYPIGGKYKIVSGHRRFRAMKARNEATIPCIVRTDLSSKDLPFVSLVENLQRKQLTPRELVTVFDDLKKVDPSMTDTKIAKLVGKSSTWVHSQYKYVDLYDALVGEGIPEDVLSSLSYNVLRNLVKVKSPKERAYTAKQLKSKDRMKSSKEQIEIIKKAVSFEPVHKRELSLDERLYNELVETIQVYDAGDSGVLVSFKDEAVKRRFLKEAWDYRRIEMLQRILPLWASDALQNLRKFVSLVVEQGDCNDAEFILKSLDKILYEGNALMQDYGDDLTKRLKPLKQFVPKVEL